MAIDDLRIFMQERLRAFDPNIDLSEGSPAMRQVVSPLLSRFSPDPLEPNFLKFALTRLQQEFPQLFTREGSALADTLIKPMQVLAEPFRREIRSVKRQLSLAYPENLNKREADDLMFNTFTRRKSGDYARVKVRVYYANPVSVTVGSSNFAYTANGLRFVPSVPQRITAEGMLLNQDGDLYYIDVSFVSEVPGYRYNIAAGDIIGVTGLTAATRASNLARAKSGLDEETTAEFVVRGERGIGERSIITVPGAVAVLFEEFSELLALKLVGFGDPDMQRDVIKGNSLGDILYYGTDGATPDDGHIDAYTSWFDSASGAFTSRLGPVGTDLSSYTLTVIVSGVPQDIQLGRVLGATRVSINDQYTGTDRIAEHPTTDLVWVLRKRGTITLSEIPGGILFPNTNATTSEVVDDEVHIGGCVDFFVRGGTTEEKAVAIQLIADELSLARGEDAQTSATSDVVTLNDLTVDEFAGVAAGQSLYLETGLNPGPYQITSIVSTPSKQVRIKVPDVSLMQAGTEISFVVVDDIDINLLAPKDIRYAASDLRTYGGSPLVDTGSGAPDFSAIGVVETDYVEIINGDDKDEYAIAAGGVSANEIILETSMTQTASPLQYRIYSKGSGIELPLLRVKDVELLDASLNPQGVTIPYGDAVDIRSESFQNPGRGAKAGTSVAALGDTVSRVASPDEDLIESSEAINYYDLGVRVGDQVNLETSDNQGYYTVFEVGGDPGAATLSAAPTRLRVDRVLPWPASGMVYQVGSPSVGTMRLYFLHPCTAEFTSDQTVFSVESVSGTRTYRPDPDVSHEYLPTGTTISTAGITAASDQVALVQERGGTGSEISAELHKVAVGDRVSITYAPIVGAIDLASNVDVNGLTFKVDLGSGMETVTLSGTSVSIDALVSQINAGLSRSVAEKYVRVTAPAGTYLMFRSSSAITIYGTGTANAVVLDDPGAAPDSRGVLNPWLTGEFTGSTTTNDSPDQGFYEVSATTTNLIDLIDLAGAAFNPADTIETELGHYIHFSTDGVQRISSTSMQGSMDNLGFYYVDVECVSIGYGDTWNIEAGVKATVTGHVVEGWTISVENENLSYSVVEAPWLHVHPRLLPAGMDDDPANYAELVGTSVQVTYERAPLVADVNSYVIDKGVRVLTSSPLARSLLPTFVRIAIRYRGGDTVEDARNAVTDAILAVLPDGELTVSSLIKIFDDSGSSYIQQPIMLVGITHQVDRSIVVDRSEDVLNVGALSMLMPDDDDLTVEGASYLFLTRVV